MSIVKPKITDWIQAVSAAISIPAAIVAFVTFFLKDRDLQKQINDLDTIAKESQNQTEILYHQLEVLRNELNHQKNQDKIQNEQRRNEIKPRLSIELKNLNSGFLSIDFSNNGKIAQIMKIKEILGNDFVIDFPIDKIGENSKQNILLKKKDKINDDKLDLKFILTYKDIDGNLFQTYFNYEDVELKINNKTENQVPWG